MPTVPPFHNLPTKPRYGMVPCVYMSVSMFITFGHVIPEWNVIEEFKFGSKIFSLTCVQMAPTFADKVQGHMGRLKF